MKPTDKYSDNDIDAINRMYEAYKKDEEDEATDNVHFDNSEDNKDDYMEVEVVFPEGVTRPEQPEVKIIDEYGMTVPNYRYESSSHWNLGYALLQLIKYIILIAIPFLLGVLNQNIYNSTGWGLFRVLTEINLIVMMIPVLILCFKVVRAIFEDLDEGLI